jgi:hypothetical protein
LRIDSHHSFSDRYPLDHLESILGRNRFEGSILVGEPVPTPDFVKGIVLPSQHRHRISEPKVCGVQHDFSSGEIPDWLGSLIRLDVLHGLSQVPEIVQRHPGLKLAIDHLGAPPSPNWQREMDRAAEHPQVFCKLSGLMRFGEPRPFVRHAMAAFGPQRLMFGSDWPEALPEHTWKANLAAFTQAIGAQSIEVREELLGGVAARFYGL